MKTLQKNVEEMRGLAKLITNISFPRSPPQTEIELAWLKQRDIVVDGYEVGLHFNISDYGTCLIESLQIYGKQFTYLPFRVVVKVVQAFLGVELLSLTEMMYNGLDDSLRNIYVWTAYCDKEWKRITDPFHPNSLLEEVDGFKFYRVTKEITFF